MHNELSSNCNFFEISRHNNCGRIKQLDDVAIYVTHIMILTIWLTWFDMICKRMNIFFMLT